MTTPQRTGKGGSMNKGKNCPKTWTGKHIFEYDPQRILGFDFHTGEPVPSPGALMICKACGFIDDRPQKVVKKEGNEQ